MSVNREIPNPYEFSERLAAISADLESLKHDHENGYALLERYTKSLCDRLGIEFVNDPSLVLRAIDAEIDRLTEFERLACMMGDV
jgi:hypothetical protein